MAGNHKKGILRCVQLMRFLMFTSRIKKYETEYNSINKQKMLKRGMKIDVKYFIHNY